MQRDPLKTANEALHSAVRAHPAFAPELRAMAARLDQLVDAVAPVISAPKVRAA